MTDYRAISLWHDTINDDWPARPVLPGPREFDVAIVGAGYTGLWTAYYLAKTDPTLHIAVIEKEVAGFGASGRNGGWCSAIFPASMRKIASHSSPHDAVAMQHAMNATVTHIGETVVVEGIDCDWQQGGYVSFARNQAQLTRAKEEVEEWRAWGFGEEQERFLEPDEVAQYAHATDVLGGTYTPHCAVVHPAKLARGLARAVEALGVTIFEKTSVVDITPNVVNTVHGDVAAEVIIRATEGYTSEFPRHRRDIVPMYSLMVATEPLSDQTWDAIGLGTRPTFSDKRHLRIYGQRTADNRFAFGGRGAPYHYGSKVEPEFDRDARVHGMLERILVDLFPVLDGVQFTHAWGGNLGMSRDWYPSVGFNRSTGLGFAGGYVGDGVATANLAGRTLAARITGVDPYGVLELPWLRRVSPLWEPEPARWVGVNAATALFATADLTEARTGKPSAAAAAFWKAIGH